ncbi:AfsR/SARP family transcriptional regulator [Actinoplanes palleronii]|uniref:SARP family transcriptional regulator n=1 Tax=Actinoplanes palleronii TaxID=113570 RepID=A0ABQ4B020_9ACTN|nr:BTAD domain-containing putative transcriptional regulator [Actinoplanes palleronii]GIE64019.1 SARP family transcriptional regulator [Actinoplanes palleronii]
MIEIRVLGPVEVLVRGDVVPLGGHQQQAVLAMLVAAGGEVVTVDRIVDQLWGETPPPRPLVSLQAYVSRLRRLLEPDRLPRAAAVVLVSEGSGYALRLPAGAVDAWEFERLLQQVQEMRTLGLSPANAEAALTLLRRATALWHGDPYEQFADEPWAGPVITRLAESRLIAGQRIAASLLVLGRFGEAVPATRALAEAEPLRGLAWRLWAVALWAAHRSAEALDVLRRHRRHLADELGLEPEPALADLEQAILEQRHEVLAAELRFGLPADDPFPVRPAQLPRSPATFAARESEMAELDRHTADPDGTPLTVISGVGGVGKTTLAVRWAHQAAGRYPDGQLYADLRGYGPEDTPLAPGDVLLGFLGALGVADHRVPPGETERTTLFRSVLAGRRMLLVLDNARDAEQVRPLLPGAAGCAVVVTSRHRLGGLLVTDGARPLHLDGFRDEQARAYLRGRLGAALADGEPAARDAIVARCGGLPLALAVVCARVGFTLGTVAEELAEEEGLAAFAVDGVKHDLRAVFSWSYRRLPAAAAELFRHLALHPGSDLPLAAAVNMAGRDRAGTRALLRTLCDAHLMSERRPGRYGYHDLVRAYAVELAHRQDEPAARADVLRRLVEYHLHTALRAADVYLSYPRPVRGGAMAEDIVPDRFTSREAALAWMDAEYETTMALAELCRTPGRERYLGPFVWALIPYQQDIRFHLEDSFTLSRWALAVAERSDDQWWIGFLSYVIGRGHLWLNRMDEARPYLEQAIEVGRRTGDKLRLAHGLLGTAVAIIGLNSAPTREQAIAAYPYGQEALEAYRLDNAEMARFEEASSLHPIGWYHFYQPGGRAKARELFQQSFEIHMRGENTLGAAGAAIQMGLLMQTSGDLPAAIAAFQQALDLYGTSMPSRRIEPLIGLYTAHRSAGDDAAAERARAEALGLLETARYPDLARIQAVLGAPQI